MGAGRGKNRRVSAAAHPHDAHSPKTAAEWLLAEAQPLEERCVDAAAQLGAGKKINPVALVTDYNKYKNKFQEWQKSQVQQWRDERHRWERDMSLRDELELEDGKDTKYHNAYEASRLLKYGHKFTLDRDWERVLAIAGEAVLDKVTANENPHTIVSKVMRSVRKAKRAARLAVLVAPKAFVFLSGGAGVVLSSSMPVDAASFVVGCAGPQMVDTIIDWGEEQIKSRLGQPKKNREEKKKERIYMSTGIPDRYLKHLDESWTPSADQERLVRAVFRAETGGVVDFENVKRMSANLGDYGDDVYEPAKWDSE